MNTKTCNICKISKSIDDFTRMSRHSDKRRCSCKPCLREKEKAYRKTPEGKASKRKAHLKYLENPVAKEGYSRYQSEYARSEEGRAADKKWKDANQKKMKIRALKRKFGITEEQHNDMLSKQNNSCQICKKPETKVHRPTGKVCDLAVDHCHVTGKVRGLLCFACNSSLGQIKESIETLQNAIEYLKRHS